MGYFRPNFPKIFLASDWWRASSEIFGKIFGKASEKRGQGKAEKKQGGVGGEGQKKAGRGGWVMTSSKK